MFHLKNCSIMNYIVSYCVHSENDAYKLINIISDANLLNTQLSCFVDNIAYSMYYDVEKSRLRSTAYPFSIKSKDVRQAFKDAVFAIYHTNFL